MALWQYNFFILPRHSVLNNKFTPEYDENDLFEDDIYWSEVSIQVSLFDDIEKKIPRGKSWSNDLLVLGDLESNCLEVYSEESEVRSVSIRVDFTSDYEGFLRLIVEFVILKDLVLLSEEKDLLKPNYVLMKNKVESSLQFRKYKKLSLPH